jgi:hypothetical protein
MAALAPVVMPRHAWLVGLVVPLTCDSLTVARDKSALTQAASMSSNNIL